MKNNIPEKYKNHIEEWKNNFKERIDNLPDQTNDAIENVRKYVKELQDIEDIEKATKDDTNWNNRLLTILSWYEYLKKSQNGSPEHKEAEELFLSIVDKVPKLKDWVNEIINEEVKGYKGFEMDDYKIYKEHKDLFDFEDKINKEAEELGIDLTKEQPKRQLSEEAEKKKKYLLDLLSEEKEEG